MLHVGVPLARHLGDRGHDHAERSHPGCAGLRRHPSGLVAGRRRSLRRVYRPLRAAARAAAGFLAQRLA
jgi:hypothetical protein